MNKYFNCLFTLNRYNPFRGTRNGVHLRGQPDILFWFWQQMGLYSLYEHKHPLATFPTIPGFDEIKILTTGQSEKDVVNEILHRCGLSA